MQRVTPHIILDNPQMGENIGMVARAMLNFGLQDLHLINPRDGWPNDKAVQASAGAADIVFANSNIYDTIEEALKPYHFVFVTTSRKRQQAIEVISIETMLNIMQQYSAQHHAILFGCERSGLDNDALSYGDYIIELPTNPDFSSLNLSQAVLLISYHIAQFSQHYTISHVPHEIAPISEMDALLTRLLTTLDEKGFFKEPAMKPIVTRNIRNSMKRGKWSQQELRTLHGMLTSLTRVIEH